MEKTCRQSPSQEQYDIAILGAGPAGANLARLMDSRRYRVLLIDGGQQHDKVCGGLLSPDAQDILARYDINLPKEILVNPQLFSVRTIDLESGLTRRYRRSYMNVDRRKFDAFLLHLVPNTVDILSCRCEQITETADGYRLFLNGDPCHAVTCRHLVGADGASSLVRRSFFPHAKLQKYIAIQQWFPAGRIDPYYSCLFDAATSTGCSWIFFKDGMLIFGGAYDMPHGRLAFEEQKRKLISLGIVPEQIFTHPQKTEACSVSRPHLTYGICRGGGHIHLIGEAAGWISPSSFEGISYALSSAEALADAFAETADDARITTIYHRKTIPLARKIQRKCLKRPFMYHPLLRTWIMKSGITAIHPRKELSSCLETPCQTD